MSQVVGLPNNSCKPITNTAWVHARLCKLQKGCFRLAATSDKVYQLLAHGRWFSPGTPASSTTKTGRHDIAESDVKHNKSNLLQMHMTIFMLGIIQFRFVSYVWWCLIFFHHVLHTFKQSISQKLEKKTYLQILHTSTIIAHLQVDVHHYIGLL